MSSPAVVVPQAAPQVAPPARVARALAAGGDAVRRHLLLVAIALVVALAAGAATWAHVSTAQALDRTEDDLAATQRRLAGTDERLASTAGTLADRRAALATLEGDLAAATATVADLRGQLLDRAGERDGVQQALDATAAQLDEVARLRQAVLERLFTEAVQVSALERCLGGVERALTRITFDDAAGATAALAAVDDSCTVAERSLAAAGG